MPLCTVTPNVCGTPAATAGMNCVVSCFPLCSSLPGGTTTTQLVSYQGNAMSLPPGMDSSSYQKPTTSQVNHLSWTQFGSYDGVCRQSSTSDTVDAWFLYRTSGSQPSVVSSGPAPSASSLPPQVSEAVEGVQHWWTGLSVEMKAGLAVSASAAVLFLGVSLYNRIVMRRANRRAAAEPSRQTRQTVPQTPVVRRSPQSAASQAPIVPQKLPQFTPSNAGASKPAVSKVPSVENGPFSARAGAGVEFGGEFHDTIPPPPPPDASTSSAVKTVARPPDATVVYPPTATMLRDAGSNPRVMMLRDDKGLADPEATPRPSGPGSIPGEVIAAIDVFALNGKIDLSEFDGFGVKIPVELFKSVAILVYHFCPEYRKQMATILRNLMQQTALDVSGGVRRNVPLLVTMNNVIGVLRQQYRMEIERTEMFQILEPYDTWIHSPSVGEEMPMPLDLQALHKKVLDFLNEDPLYRLRPAEERQELAQRFVSACDSIQGFAQQYAVDGRISRSGIDRARELMQTTSEYARESLVGGVPPPTRRSS